MQTYKARITAEGQQYDPNNDGVIEDLPVGTIITGPDAWRLCLTFFRNQTIAEPADDVTAAKVAEYRAATQPAKDAARDQLQNQINALALDPKVKLSIGSDGKPQRDGKGELIGKLSNIQRHRLETALAYGMVPDNGQGPAAAPAPKTKPTAPAEAAA
jgi:hypothetical protein